MTKFITESRKEKRKLRGVIYDQTLVVADREKWIALK